MKDLLKKRILTLKSELDKPGKIIYWMSRDQRVNDNWALLAAQDYAFDRNEKFEIVFCLAKDFLSASQRHFGFMLEGLKETATKLAGLNIPFILLNGEPGKTLINYLENQEVGALFCDFDPLLIKKLWQRKVVERSNIPIYEVDTHNVIPARLLSDKAEFAAYTIRPKIHKLLDEFLIDIPAPLYHYPNGEFDLGSNHFDYDLSEFSANPGLTNFEPGENAAHVTLNYFISNKINNYNYNRNNPNIDGQSNLSPYLHFGMISAQRCAHEVSKLQQSESTTAYIEELIVRRELAENFVLFNEKYDSFEGIHPWAAKTLDIHRDDRREFIYGCDEFELAKTHDKYWNAAQSEMVNTGKMHGYLRMYWAKKILEWSPSPESAIETAIYLNDKYELDGRDPNGYAGILWSIGGLHDRAWQERPVFGKIRYMNAAGLKRKFDMDSYVKKISSYDRTLF